jgi:radical SAM-linked protein
MKARIKFSKTGSMRFIGHLDVMRYFQKAFRRAKIPVSYSQGFSPHQILSFTSPLGIGLTSDGEYMDMELTECPDPERMVDWMNTQMNEEIRVKEFMLLPDDSKPSMAMLAGCDYIITLKPEVQSPFRDSAFVEEKSNLFLSQSEIRIIKKTKRSEKEVDIRPNLYHVSHDRELFESMTGQEYGALSIDLQEFVPVLFCQLTAGSVVNIKPELVMEAFCDFVGTQYRPLDYQIHRLEMYGDLDGKKGEVHLLGDETPCRLVPLSEYP